MIVEVLDIEAKEGDLNPQSKEDLKELMADMSMCFNASFHVIEEFSRPDILRVITMAEDKKTIVSVKYRINVFLFREFKK